MKPGTYNFEVYPGADLSEAFVVSGMDLTGYTARSKMRAIWSTSVYDLSATIDDSTISISIPGATTTSIPQGSYFWDLEIIAAGGQIYRLLSGNVLVNSEATR